MCWVSPLLVRVPEERQGPEQVMSQLEEGEVGVVVVDRPMREEGEAAAETTRRGIVPGRTKTRPDGETTIGNGDTTRRWPVEEV